MTRSRRSTVYLLALALGGGFADAASYLGFGKVFTANMTGNTVLLGVALARGSGADAARAGSALAGFCVGAALGVLLIPRLDRSWPGNAGAAFALEAAALAATVGLWAGVGLHQVRYWLVVLAGIAMGGQSAAVRASDVRGVNTTYMTSTLLNAIARTVGRGRGSPQAEQVPNLPAAAWVTYGLGAVGGAFAVKSWRAGAFSVPLAVVAAVLVAVVLERSER